MVLAGRDAHAKRREAAVHADGVEQVPADKLRLHAVGEPREVLTGERDRLHGGKSAHVDEREDLLVAHAIGRFADGALVDLSVEDQHLTAQVVAAPDAEVPEFAHGGDADAGLVRPGQQGVEDRELGHRGIRGMKARHGARLSRDAGSSGARRAEVGEDGPRGPLARHECALDRRGVAMIAGDVQTIAAPGGARDAQRRGLRRERIGDVVAAQQLPLRRAGAPHFSELPADLRLARCGTVPRSRHVASTRCRPAGAYDGAA